MAEFAAHGNYLAFVMKGVGEDVMKNKGRSANGVVSVRKIELCLGVQLLLSQPSEILERSISGFPLKTNGVSDGRKFRWLGIDVIASLKDADPEAFAIEDVNHLLLYGIEPEAGKFSCVGVRWESRYMPEQESEAGVRPIVQFANAVDGEHPSLPQAISSRHTCSL